MIFQLMQQATSARALNRSAMAGALGTLAAGVLVLGGCQGDFAADITNKTPQPVYASIVLKGSDRAVLGASRRLGPGDRAFVGPVRTDRNKGAYLTVDTMPNPGRPVTVDLPEGTSYLEVQQDGAQTSGPLRVVQKP